MDIAPKAYAHWRESELGSVTERLEQEAIFSNVTDLSGWKVLDAGCGDGTYAIEASRRGAIVNGLDSSWPLLVAARQREQQSLSETGILWCHGQVEALPFRADSFDLILAITLLCVVSSPERVMGELVRVLRPGGMLLLGELGRFNTWAFLRSWLSSEFWKGAHFWTTGELDALIGVLGWT
jgi:ubiquinone/menaquinone biosynthesis C-methylase UbiE